MLGLRLRVRREPPKDPMTAALLLGGVAIAATVLIHFAGTVGLGWLLQTRNQRYQPQERMARESLGILFVVFALLGLHFAEMLLYALLYLAVQAVPDLETALYFSMASFTTIGFGDVVIARPWRLVSTMEGANGLMLFGWSVAFLTGFLGRVRSVSSDP